jgi:hypothetical protein
LNVLAEGEDDPERIVRTAGPGLHPSGRAFLHQIDVEVAGGPETGLDAGHGLPGRRLSERPVLHFRLNQDSGTGVEIDSLLG